MTTKYAYPVDTGAMMSSLKPMPRAQREVTEKFPKHTVPNTSLGKSGITISEEVGPARDSAAELEVLKAILNREGYLTRLKQVARTVGRKFKPEVADVLDLVRASTLDVVDMILRWREAKASILFRSVQCSSCSKIYGHIMIVLSILYRKITTRRSCGMESIIC